MPGKPLKIGETNPKKGAVQFDNRRIDGVPFVIPAAAGITSAPVGSVVTLQEDTSGNQKIVLGAGVYTDDEYATFSVVSIGFLEVATQASGAINPTVGTYADGDLVAMVSDPAAVVMAPYDTSNKPDVNETPYVNVKGQLTSSNSSTVAFPGKVWYGTAGVQLSNQLKSGYAFARIKFGTLA